MFVQTIFYVTFLKVCHCLFFAKYNVVKDMPIAIHIKHKNTNSHLYK